MNSKEFEKAIGEFIVQSVMFQKEHPVNLLDSNDLAFYVIAYAVCVLLKKSNNIEDFAHKLASAVIDIKS